MKRRRPGSPPTPCTRCNRPTAEPRRGLCTACYLSDHTGRSKLPGCEVCEKQDPAVLVRRSVVGDVRTLCGDCATRLGRRRISLADLRREVRPPGDRRQQDRRRGGRRAPGPERRCDVALDVEREQRSAQRGRRGVELGD